MKTDENTNVIIDFEADPNDYKDMDELLHINPKELSQEEKKVFLEICDICPDINIDNDLSIGSSTVTEYKNAELWIANILETISSEWSDIQKIAFIDNAIGKKISYSPDFDTEVSDLGAARALWKIIDSGYGVCNGIAEVEQYILNKVKIESQIISGQNHAFLKINNLEIADLNGNIVKGNTVLDPTWNLNAHRYGAKPENFCRSYEEIRKHDIRKNGEDSNIHKNDENLIDATLNLDEQTLRQIYKSIGIADIEGNFPVKKLIELSKKIDDLELPVYESLKQQLTLLQNYQPDFATCQHPTQAILQGVILNNKNLKFNKCIVDRVYDRNDENKEPVIYIYIDVPNEEKKLYYIDRSINEFIESDQNTFIEKFEFYEMDLEKNNGLRPWEIKEIENIEEDLTRSSGKIVAVEEEVR